MGVTSLANVIDEEKKNLTAPASSVIMFRLGKIGVEQFYLLRGII